MKTNTRVLNPAATYVNEATALTRARYQRISPIYDKVESLMESRFRPWRKRLCSEVRGPQVLEVGVGTGKNMEFWPLHFKITAIDLTPGMLTIAQERAKHLNRHDHDLRLGDVQHLNFSSRSFDSVIATFVFCSVPDPIQGLRELGRVVRPNGQILLLEHVRVDHYVIGTLMDLIAPLIVRLYGASINRRTVENVTAAGLKIDHVKELDAMGMFKLISARAQA
jgi:ubiquinone/menaquinone biosynthesis C-methylase UbiE